MSMMNANAAATTAMTANKPLDFELPEIGEAEFSNEELAEDMDGLTMSFPRIKIPAGGVLQFEIPNGDPQHPDYRPTLTGVILYNHASCAEMLKRRQGQNEKAEAGTLHYRQTHVRSDGGQTRHLQYGRRDVPYGPCSEDP